MVFNVMIQLCKITRASKLFQRNFYLPLLKPLSPKDAIRRKIITGQNVLGSRIEHYIPVLEEYRDRVQRRKYMVKGLGKKRQRKKTSKKYLMPMFDETMENHSKLIRLLSRKSKGRGQCYTYYVPDKKCTLVFSHQMERAIRDRDILDVIIAQRSEKIVVKLKDDTKIVLPLVSYDGNAPFYRGEGWTKKEIEEYHHHGRETMTLAKLFEAKEQGLEDWELEMMRMANKRKRKMKGEGTVDWKVMMQSAVENMDWDNFEEEIKDIVEEIDEPADDEPIQMQVDDMDKTKNVNEKIKAAGAEVINLLPTMPEIPECIKVMQDGTVTELANISGMSLNLPSSGEGRFVPGQVVSSEDGDLFIPGQTVEKEDGSSEYTPGFTVMMDDEPSLIPGLVMGDDPEKPMFLPGDSAITESGELQFTATEDDIVSLPPPEPEPEPEPEEVELEEEQNSQEEEEEWKPPPPPKKREEKEFTYERPKRVYATESMGPKRREKSKKAPPKEEVPKVEIPPPVRVPGQPVLYDLTLPTFEKDLLQQQKELVEKFNEKKGKEEAAIDKKRREIRVLVKNFSQNKLPPPVYEPLEPVKKSEKLKEIEKNIKKGKFFDVDHKKYLNKEYSTPFVWKCHEYRPTFDSVGIMRHRVWKSVY